MCFPMAVACPFGHVYLGEGDRCLLFDRIVHDQKLPKHPGAKQSVSSAITRVDEWGKGFVGELDYLQEA